MLLFGDNEEKLLGVKMYYNDIKCIENFDFVIKFFWFLLWNEFFVNDISYFFCNNFFEGVIGWLILYVIIIIWIGYDLICKIVDINDFFEEFKVEKDDFFLIGLICCYFFFL